MDQKRDIRGFKKYEALLKTVCMVDDFSYLSEPEWEGCLGVACAISVIEGVVPNLFSLSKHLDIPLYDHHLQNAFDRLKVNGIFGNKYNIKHDPLLTGKGKDEKWRTAAELERLAWCRIAGVAGGLVGLEKNTG